MYTEHFRLSLRPFGGAGTGPFFIAGPSVAAAIARLAVAASRRDAIAALCGGTGVGKSTLIAHALAKAGERLRPLHVDLREADAGALLPAALVALGAGAPASGPAGLVQLREAVAAACPDDRHLVLVVDVEADMTRLAAPLLRLMDAANGPDGRLSVILEGPKALHDALGSSELMALRQRLACRCTLAPLGLQETDGYIRKAIVRAGGQPDTLLAANTAAAVFLYVNGIPRLIDTLMDAALCECAARGQSLLDAQVVRETAEQLGWRPLRQKPVATPRPAPAASTDVLPASDVTSRLLAVTSPPSSEDTVRLSSGR